MPRKKQASHPRFIKYAEYIINHKNYRGLPIKTKDDGSFVWVAPRDSEIGKQRKEWCINKAKELHLIKNDSDYPGMYRDVMFTIHPTKKRICSICGKEMSLYYHYPNNVFLKSLNKRFNSDFTDTDNINDIWDELIYEKEVSPEEVGEFLIKKGNLNLDCKSASKDQIINSLEEVCRKGLKKCLGPGSMSDFPDRFDGFHDYNRCCRSSHDKGRSKDNLKSYNKDRRAYEYWSGGNIHAANQFMGSKFFNGVSADHIGPISLGFVHDSRYLKPMPSGDNSSKRDRLLIEDLEKIIEIQDKTNVYPMS